MSVTEKRGRKAISARVRFEVFKRDQYVCQYCGAHPPRAILHIDHIVPVASGGGNEIDNLVTACSACNLGKGAVALSDVPIPLKEKAAEIAEREAQLRGYHEVMEARRQRLENDTWKVADAFIKQYELPGVTNAEFRSIQTFVEKLGFHETFDSMEAAIAKVTWSPARGFKYFCGTCWAKIRQGQ